MNRRSRLEEHFVYYISGILVLGGIAFVIIAEFALPPSIVASILSMVGTTLIPTGLVATIFEYYLQERWNGLQKCCIGSGIRKSLIFCQHH